MRTVDLILLLGGGAVLLVLLLFSIAIGVIDWQQATDEEPAPDGGD